MIGQHEAMEILVEACPSFTDAWREHLREHGNDLLYVAAGEFASHLLLLQQIDDESSFPAVGAAIERLYIEGSPWVRELATIGILEAVQNVWSSNGADPELFHRFLGQESKRWWQSLKEFWAGRVPYVGGGGPGL